MIRGGLNLSFLVEKITEFTMCFCQVGIKFDGAEELVVRSLQVIGPKALQAQIHMGLDQVGIIRMRLAGVGGSLLTLVLGGRTRCISLPRVRPLFLLGS